MPQLMHSVSAASRRCRCLGRIDTRATRVGTHICDGHPYAHCSSVKSVRLVAVHDEEGVELVFLVVPQSLTLLTWGTTSSLDDSAARLIDDGVGSAGIPLTCVMESWIDMGTSLSNEHQLDRGTERHECWVLIFVDECLSTSEGVPSVLWPWGHYGQALVVLAEGRRMDPADLTILLLVRTEALRGPVGDALCGDCHHTSDGRGALADADVDRKLTVPHV